MIDEVNSDLLRSRFSVIFAYIDVTPVPGVVYGRVGLEIEVSEQVLHPDVVRCLLKAKISAVFEILLKLSRVAFAKLINRSVELALKNLLKLVGLGRAF